MHHILILLVALFVHAIIVPAASHAKTRPAGLAVPPDDTWRRADVVLDALDLKPGEAVVDLGAGSGYYVGLLANLVGRRGTVYATDIDDHALRGLEGLKATHDFRQMIILRGGHRSSGLPPNSANAVLLSHTLRELKQPVQFLRDLRKALKRHARVIVVDLHRQDDGFAPPKSSRLDVAEAKKLLQRAGYRIVASKEIPRQYLLICEPN